MNRRFAAASLCWCLTFHGHVPCSGVVVLQQTGLKGETHPRRGVIVKVGAIAYRKTPNGVEVCLVSSLRHKGTLTFPKGNVKEGETLTQAVKRELFEEAGLRGKIKNKKRPFCTQMSFGKREPVFYFLFKITEMVSVWPESKRRKRLFTTIKGLKKLPLGHAPKKAAARADIAQAARP